jgi:hypothetical protein
MWFMMKAFFGHTPGKVSHSSTINFMHEKKAVNLDFQSEGEYLKLKKVQELKITKSEQFLNVILT